MARYGNLLIIYNDDVINVPVNDLVIDVMDIQTVKTHLDNRGNTYRLINNSFIIQTENANDGYNLEDELKTLNISNYLMLHLHVPTGSYLETSISDVATINELNKILFKRK